jgi:hypothetical protein
VQRIFIKKCFLFIVGSVLLHEMVCSWVTKYFADEEVEIEVQKWLRQQ